MGRIGSFIAFVLLAALTFAWIDSSRSSFLFQFLTPAGHLQVLATDRTGIVAFFSDIPFGREMGLSADGWQITADEALRLHNLIYLKSGLGFFGPPVTRPHFAGFYWADDVWQSSPTQPFRYQTLLIPYWFPLTLLSIPPMLIFLGLMRSRSRRRRGCCALCGYDLRHSADRCPECGRSTSSRGSGRFAAIFSHLRRRWPTTLLLIILVGLALALVLRRYRNVSIDDELYRNARLDFPVTEFAVDGMPYDQALQKLAQLTGARILMSTTVAHRVVDPGSVISYAGGRGVPNCWQTPVFGIFRDVPLSGILSALAAQVSDEFPVSLTYAPRDDGSILVGTDDEMPYIMRAYDLRPVYKLLDRFQSIKEPSGYEFPDDSLKYSIISVLDEQSAYGTQASPQFPGLIILSGRLVCLASRERQRQNDDLCRQLRAIHEPWPVDSIAKLHDVMDDASWKIEASK